MVVGPFVLIAGLQPLLRSTPAARVVSVTSGGQYAQRLDLDDLQSPDAAIRWHARIRTREASAGLSDARVVTPNPEGGDRVQCDAPGLGRHPRRGLRAPWFPPRDGAAPANPGAGGRHDGLAGRRPSCNRPGRAAGPRSTSTAVRSDWSTRVSPIDRRRLWDAVVRMTGLADPAPGPPHETAR